MENVNASEKDLELARICLNCPCGKNARLEQKGFFYDIVKNFTEEVCPFCQAYERVYGRKAHEPVQSQ